jgi:hypothetical protein
MSLLAYSVRRTVGAVLVLLVLIWVIQFAVYHITDSPGYEGRGGVMFLPRFLYPGLHFQPALANEWSTAAVEVGLGLLLLLAGRGMAAPQPKGGIAATSYAAWRGCRLR